MAKIIYIAHPVGGDVQGNVKKILEICKKVHSKDLIPIAPYLQGLHYLDDSNPEDRALGILTNREYFTRRFFDELHVYGYKLSNGVKGEIKLAVENEIPIKCQEDVIRLEFEDTLNSILKQLGLMIKIYKAFSNGKAILLHLEQEEWLLRNAFGEEFFPAKGSGFGLLARLKELDLNPGKIAFPTLEEAERFVDKHYLQNRIDSIEVAMQNEFLSTKNISDLQLKREFFQQQLDEVESV